MNLGFSAAIRGMPALLGVMLGVYLYTRSCSGAILLPIFALVALIVLLKIAERLFITYPLAGLLLLEPWTLASISVVSICSYAVLWLTVNADSFVILPNAADEKAVAGALIGAFTTFAATAWLKEIQESNGAFVASSQAKQFIKAFAARHEITGSNLIFDVCYADTVVIKSGKINGWGFMARWKRAGLLQHFLRAGKQPLSRDDF